MVVNMFASGALRVDRPYIILYDIYIYIYIYACMFVHVCFQPIKLFEIDKSAMKLRCSMIFYAILDSRRPCFMD
jgi:hypothetical protein